MGTTRRPLSLNRYSYTSVDPANSADPSGETEFVSEYAQLKADLAIANVAAYVLLGAKALVGYGAKKILGVEAYPEECTFWTGAAAPFIDAAGMSSGLYIGGIVALGADVACDLAAFAWGLEHQ